MQWVPAKNVEDYVLTHEDGTDGMRIVEPILTPSCLTGSPIASSDYCYIGLEVADNAQVAPDYQLSLNKGDGNLAKDNLDVGIIPIAEQGRAVLSLQQNQKTITSIYAGESFEVVVAPEEGWQDKVSQDQTFTVSINDAQITFPNGNQCVLSIDDPNAPCRILASTPVDLASNFYQIDVSSDNEIVLSAQQITFFTAIKPKAKNLSTGTYYACSLDSSMPYCWGNNNTGQLGTDLVTKSSIPVAVSQGEIPEGVELKEIAADSNKACVLSVDGKAYCWGFNAKGVLGNGSTTNSPTPVAVSQGEIPIDVSLIKISDSCALGDNAKVYCWGDNTYGGLGTDMVSGYSTTPVAIAQGDIPDGVGVIELSSHCILTDNAKAYCWGRNNEGQLGDGTKVDSFRPVEVKQGEIPLGSYLSAIDGTGYHKCGIATNGKAYCWGKNYRGQLGNNTQVDSLTPVEVSQGAIPDGVQLTDISVGYEHACVLVNDSKAYCWGAGYHGRLGDGATSIRSVPVAVSQGEIPTDVKLMSISVGASESCALGDDGNKYCWGYNYYGQLGNGTEINSSVPVKVLPATN